MREAVQTAEEHAFLYFVLSVRLGLSRGSGIPTGAQAGILRFAQNDGAARRNLNCDSSDLGMGRIPGSSAEDAEVSDLDKRMGVWTSAPSLYEHRLRGNDGRPSRLDFTVGQARSMDNHADRRNSFFVFSGSFG